MMTAFVPVSAAELTIVHLMAIGTRAYDNAHRVTGSPERARTEAAAAIRAAIGAPVLQQAAE